MKETDSARRKAPKADKEILIAKTLRRAVVDEKEIATHWAVGRRNYGKKVYMSGGGYELQFVKENGKWRFDKIGKTWIS